MCQRASTCSVVNFLAGLMLSLESEEAVLSIQGALGASVEPSLVASTRISIDCLSAPFSTISWFVHFKTLLTLKTLSPFYLVEKGIS